MYKDEREALYGNDAKFLRLLALIVTIMGSVPLFTGILVFWATGRPPAAVPWYEHYFTAVSLVVLGLVHHGLAIYLMWVSRQDQQAGRLANRIRNLIGGHPDDRLNPPV